MERLEQTDLRVNPVFTHWAGADADKAPEAAGLILENLSESEEKEFRERARKLGLCFSVLRPGPETGLFRLWGAYEPLVAFGDACDEGARGAVARALRNRALFETGDFEIADGVKAGLAAPQVWGILNVTPDSFSDGGRFAAMDAALAMAEKMIDEGAAVIDVGGESTRPGAAPVSADEESRRVIPVVEAVAGRMKAPVSIDTSKAAVALRAIEAGARIVNDVTSLSDPEMAATICGNGAGAVLMHMRGEPRTMQRDPSYANLFGEIARHLRRALFALAGAGGAPSLVDPGIGFGKTVEHNLKLVSGAAAFGSLGRPVMLGPSRKSFLGMILDLPVDERLEGTAAAAACGVMNGASVIRAHDVREMKRVVKVAAAARRAAGVMP